MILKDNENIQMHLMLEFTFVCMEAQTSSVNCIVFFFLLALLYLTLFSGLLYDVVTH